MLTVGLGTQVVKQLELRDQKHHALTEAEYDSLAVGGVTKQQVIERYGSPESTDDLGPRAGGSDCLNYNQQDGKLLDYYQLCFDGRGTLRSKDDF